MSTRVVGQTKPAPVASPVPAHRGVLQRACACGGTPGPTGECAECRRKKRLGVGSLPLQPKLRVNQPGDRFEQEADRVAEQVMRMPEPDLQRQVDEEEEEELLQTKPLVQRRITGGGGGGEAPPIVHKVLQSPGWPLDPATRAFFEPRFGYDFSRVRVHTDALAAESAHMVNARAFTVGQDIVFGAGQYEPGQREGRQLLAHELAHVIQQSGGHSQNSLLGREPLVLHSVEQSRIMRAQIFTSTLQICHQYLRSRTFRVTQGGLRVTVNAHWGPEEEGAPMPHGCRSDRPFSIELRDVGLIFDDPWGTCDFTAGEPSSRQWTNLPTGDYYLGINTPDTGPYCCLRGDIEVSQERGLTGASCTQPPPGPLEILHNALDLAGLIPALGAVPDAINAGIYVIEGDWTNAGLSAAAMIPVFGDAATIGKIGTRTVVRVTGEGVNRMGRDGIAAGLRRARQLLRTMRVPRAVAFRGSATNLDPQLLRLARDVRATQAGVSRQAFRRHNVATARVRIDGEVRYLDSGNLPSGPHSEEWLHTQITELRRRHREVVLEQLYSERIPCRGTCGPLLSREYPNAEIFFSTRGRGEAAASDLMSQYGLTGQ